MLASALVSGECRRRERSLGVAPFEGEIGENEEMSIRFSAGLNFVNWPTTVALDGGKGNACSRRIASESRIPLCPRKLSCAVAGGSQS